MPRVPNFASQDIGGANLFQAPTVSQVPNYAPQQIEQYGEALQNFGTGIQRMDTELKRQERIKQQQQLALQQQQQELQDVQDESAAKSLEEQAWNVAKRMSDDKDNGYLWTAGSVAVDAYEPTLKQLDKSLEEIAKQAKSPMQQKLLQPELVKLRDHFVGKWELHAGKEMRANAKLQATARLDRFSQMASQNWHGWENETDPTYGPNFYRDSRAQIVNETAALAKLEGIATDSPAFQSMLAKNMEAMHKATVVNILKSDDPAQAQRYAARFLDEGELDAKTYGATRTQARSADDGARATAIGMSLWQGRQGLSGDQLIASLPGRVQSNEVRVEDVDEIRKTILAQQTAEKGIKTEQLAADLDSARTWFRQQRDAGAEPDVVSFRRMAPDLAGRIESNGGFTQLETLEQQAKQPGWAYSPQAVAVLERMRSDRKLADQDLAKFGVDWHKFLNQEQMSYWKSEIRKAQEARGTSDYKPELSEHEHAWLKWLRARPDDKDAWEKGKTASDRNAAAKEKYGQLLLSQQRLSALIDERVTEADTARAQKNNPRMTRTERDAMVQNIIEDFQLVDIDAEAQVTFDSMDKLFEMEDIDRLTAVSNLQVALDNGENVKLVDLPKDQRLIAALLQEQGYSDYTSVKDLAQMWANIGRPKSMEDLVRRNNVNMPLPEGLIRGIQDVGLQPFLEKQKRLAASIARLQPVVALGTPMTVQGYSDMQQQLSSDQTQYSEVMGLLSPSYSEARVADFNMPIPGTLARGVADIGLQPFLDTKQRLETDMAAQQGAMSKVNPMNPTKSYDEAQKQLSTAQKSYSDLMSKLSPDVSDSHLTNMQRANVERSKVYDATIQMANGMQQRAMQAVMMAQQLLEPTGDEQYLSDRQQAALLKQKEQRSAELLAYAARTVNQSKNLQENLEATAIDNIQMINKLGVLDATETVFVAQRLAATAEGQMPSGEVETPSWTQDPNDPQWRQMRTQMLRSSARNGTYRATVARTMHDELLQSARVWRDIALSYYPIDRLANMTQLESQHHAWLVEHAQRAEAKAKSLKSKYEGRWNMPEKERKAPQAKVEHDTLVKAAKMARSTIEMTYPYEQGTDHLSDTQKINLRLLIEQAQAYERKAEGLSNTYSDYWGGK